MPAAEHFTPHKLAFYAALDLKTGKAHAKTAARFAPVERQVIARGIFTSLRDPARRPISN